MTSLKSILDYVIVIVLKTLLPFWGQSQKILEKASHEIGHAILAKDQGFEVICIILGDDNMVQTKTQYLTNYLDEEILRKYPLKRHLINNCNIQPLIEFSIKRARVLVAGSVSQELFCTRVLKRQVEFTDSHLRDKMELQKIIQFWEDYSPINIELFSNDITQYAQEYLRNNHRLINTLMRHLVWSKDSKLDEAQLSKFFQ